MSYSYQAWIMLPTDNSPSSECVKNRLQEVFDRVNPAAVFTIKPDYLIISIEDWQIQIYLNHDPAVLAESQEIAELYLEPNDPQKSALVNYGFRLEISCDRDRNLERFSYYIFVLEALETFAGAIVFNPITTGFILS